jgi:hypothetical protein
MAIALRGYGDSVHVNAVANFYKLSQVIVLRLHQERTLLLALLLHRSLVNGAGPEFFLMSEQSRAKQLASLDKFNQYVFHGLILRHFTDGELFSTRHVTTFAGA